MSKPDDIAQWAWDKARDVAFDFDCDWTHGDRLEADAIVAIARAIMTAKAEAYEDAAKMIEEGFDRVVGEPYADDGSPSKNDKCPHNRYMYEDCEACCVGAIRSKANCISKAKHLR